MTTKIAGMTVEGFAASAAKLAGFAGAVLGWRPDEFWRATPAELAGIFEAMRGDAESPAGSDVLAQLKELYPDG